MRIDALREECARLEQELQRARDGLARRSLELNQARKKRPRPRGFAEGFIAGAVLLAISAAPGLHGYIVFWLFQYL
jgi:hypothetical protein